MNKIEKAISKANLIPFEKGKHRIYSIVYDKRGRRLSEAGNSYTKTSPKMRAYASDVNIPEKDYWHAECLAISRIPSGAVPYRIVIARVNRKGESLLSAPCPVCCNAIKKSGIKVVEYTV